MNDAITNETSNIEKILAAKEVRLVPFYTGTGYYVYADNVLVYCAFREELLNIARVLVESLKK